MKISVNSFDIFDTLIARKVNVPTDIFNIIENKGYSNFKYNRILAQSQSNGLYDDIYNKYQKITNISDEERNKLYELEIQTEEDNIYIIQQNYNKVSDGDILVSDMYLSEPIIRRILNKIGFNKEVTIFVTPGGKYSGTIWPLLKQTYDIKLHIGDNYISDVESPNRNGIPSVHTTLHEFTDIEKYIISLGLQTLAHIFRQFRLSNPYLENTNNYNAYNLQATYNIPMLILTMKQISEYYYNEHLESLLLSTRDCCLMEKLFSVIYPDINSHKFHISRMALLNNQPSYHNYLRKMYVPGKSMIVDLNGAFKTGRSLFLELFGHYPRVHIIGYIKSRAEIYDKLTYSISNDMLILEYLNLDIVGPLINVTYDGKDIRIPNILYDIDYVYIYHKAIEDFISFIKNNNYINNMKNFIIDINGDSHVWINLCNLINTQNVNNIVHNIFNFKSSLEHETLTTIANKYNTDKGTTYACAHNYTQSYQEILSEYSTVNTFKLLEIGLCRDLSNTIPSINMWKEYFGNRIKIYGFDILPIFKTYESINDNITIIIGDQSNAYDLTKCKEINPEGFEIIIDDGYHASKHQQISLLHLWNQLNPGGLYIIEDLHYQPDQNIEPSFENKTKQLLIQWSNNIPLSTEFIDTYSANRILSEIDTISFYDSYSNSPMWEPNSLKNALAVIKKKK
jgi:hypothetical protein